RLVEQPGITDRIEPTASLVVTDRIRFDLRPFALHVRLAAEVNGLGITALDDQGVGHIVRDAVRRQLEERVDHRVGRWEAPGRAGRQAEPAGGRSVEAALGGGVRGGASSAAAAAEITIA